MLVLCKTIIITAGTKEEKESDTGSQQNTGRYKCHYYPKKGCEA